MPAFQSILEDIEEITGGRAYWAQIQTSGGWTKPGALTVRDTYVVITHDETVPPIEPLSPIVRTYIEISDILAITLIDIG